MVAIEKIPKRSPKTKLPSLLEPVLRQLAQRDEPTAEAYLSSCIGPRFALSTPDLRAYRRHLRSYRNEMARANKTKADPSPPEILQQDDRVISPAQDFVGDKAFTCVSRTEVTPTRTGHRRRVRMPYLVTSDRECFRLSAEELAARGLRVAHEDLPPADLCRWSVDPAVPNSVGAFLQGKARVDTLALFEEIEAYYRRYLEFPDPRAYAFLALWSIGTYVYMLFESYPYVYILATMGSGKTRTLEVASKICFRASLAVSISTASLYRTVEADRCTILIDEAEEYRSRRVKNGDTLAVLNGGYKRSGSVRRTDPRTGCVVSFSVYSPKMLANIEGLDPTTLDRTVLLPIVRAKTDKEEFRTLEMESELSALRNSLHVFGLTYHSAIREIYAHHHLSTDYFANRERELWWPIIALATFVDSERKKRVSDLDDEDHLTMKMARFALASARWKREIQADETLELQVLRGVTEYIEWVGGRNPTSAGLRNDLYWADELLQFIRRHEGIRRLTKNSLTRTLKKLQILRSPGESLYRKRPDGVRALVYELSSKRVQGARECYRV